MKLMLSILLIVVLHANGNSEHIYSTWDSIELDTCASAWLIKRFVDKEAEFLFYPKGEFITKGIPFDTPEAELRRRHGISTFESIIAKFGINDLVVLEIGKIIHEIEVDYWRGEQTEKGKELNAKINLVISENKEPEKIFEETFLIMDDLYKNIKKP